jgi:hypothetical protein
MEKQIPEFIKNIDWSELRNQKSSLIAVKTYYENNNVPFIPEHLDGIVHLIDALQDYAVDDAKIIDAIHVYDFEAEEERETETPEQTFARENAQLIFEKWIEGQLLYEDDEMTREFIEGIIDDRFNILCIKAKMSVAIYNDVIKFPKQFERDAEGKLVYSGMMDIYGEMIGEYCRDLIVK